MDVRDIPVMILPELAAAASQAKQLDIYVAWAAIRAIDRHKETQGKGWFTVGTLQTVMANVLGVQLKYTYTLIKKGIGVFWSAPSGARGSQRIYLISMTKVIDKLKPSMARTRPYIWPLKDLFANGTKGSSHLKILLSAAIAGRYSGQRPVTIASLGKEMGVSRSTIKRRLRESPDIQTVRNYGKVHCATTINEAHTVLAKLMVDPAINGKKAFRLHEIAGNFHIVQQLANSYTMPEPYRPSITARPKELRAVDGLYCGQWDTRKYHQSEHKAKPKSDVWFSPAERTKTNEGYIRLWNTHGILIDPALLEIAHVGARCGNWNAIKHANREQQGYGR